MMSWYVGQKVMCVDGLVFRGDVGCIPGRTYTIHGVSKCCMMLLDIGATQRTDGTSCDRCGGETGGPIWWLRADRFRPIDNFTEQIERIESEGAPVGMEPAVA